MVGGTNTSIYTLSKLFTTKTKNIFSAEVRDVHFADVNVGTVVGDHSLLRSTTDGGMTWETHHEVAPAFAKASYLRKTWTVNTSLS